MKHWHFFQSLFAATCLVCQQLIADYPNPRLCEACDHACQPKPLQHGCLSLVPWQEHGSRSPIVWFYSAYGYHGPVATLLKQFKYQQCLLSGLALADLLDRATTSLDWAQFDGIMVMPAHPRRIRERGAHVCDFLIRTVLKKTAYLSLLQTQLGWRRTYQAPQVSLSGSARKSSVAAGDFKVPKFVGHWLIFDDVVTTGTSLRALVQALEHSKLQVSILTLAQTDMS